MPTWSPFPTPREARKWASRLASDSSSAYVATRLPTWITPRSGTTSTACSKRSAMLSATGARLEHVLVLVYGCPMPDALPHALIELHEHTLVVTMNRPEKKNALSGAML